MEMDCSAIQLQPNPVEQFVRLKLGVQAKPLVGLGEGDLENSAHVRAKIKCGAPLLLVFRCASISCTDDCISLTD